MSSESVEFNEEDMDENAGMGQQKECEIGDNISDKMALESNLELKMRNMHGYNFKNNENFKAMKKIIPLLDQAQHVEIKSDTIYKDQEQMIEFEQIIKQESMKMLAQDQNKMIVDQVMHDQFNNG
jgi:hypothetical protein